MATYEFAALSLADRIKSVRRSSTQKYSNPAHIPEAVIALATFAAARVPPPTSTISAQHVAPRSPLKRKADSTLEQTGHRKSNNSFTPRKLSQTASAIKLRESRAAEKSARHDSSDAECDTQTRDLLDPEHVVAPSPSEEVPRQLINEVPAEVNKQRAHTRRSIKSPTLPSASVATPSKSSANTSQDMIKYAKAGEDLDWTKMEDPKQRRRLQSIISTRKSLEKKKQTAEKSITPHIDTTVQLAKTASVKPSQLRNAQLFETSRPHKAQTSPVQLRTPAHDLSREQALALTDFEYVEMTKMILESTSKGHKAVTFAVQQARRILQLLNVATTPEPNEALVASGDVAAQYLAAGQYFAGPIFTAGQQSLPLQTVDKFLSECYDDDADVYVQDPAVRVARGTPHVRSRTMAEVKERFAQPVTDMPWNLLELAAHREDGLRPAFLNTEDCCLLSKLKLPGSADKASRKGYEKGWKEVEKWTLVAQAGALTEPHQDSHGYSTYITVNHGIFGFGWLSNPTLEERTAWSRSPHNYIGGRWRYAIIRAGQTVYFPAGTVHFVFRLPAAGNTLAFGGHVLRNSQIVRWIKTLIEEKQAPSITNEDLTVSAPGYLDRVEKWARQALASGLVKDMERWGGEQAIEEFLRLKVEFETMKKKKG
ncbi:hypothetical protein LTR08_008117 [Meristemomyces frigidus]|nr:hypothetical protein LTR08_008117 [Meristemomyces frigidus]